MTRLLLVVAAGFLTATVAGWALLVGRWAFGKLTVELARGGVAALTRRYRTRGGTR